MELDFEAGSAIIRDTSHIFSPNRGWKQEIDSYQIKQKREKSIFIKHAPFSPFSLFRYQTDETWNPIHVLNFVSDFSENRTQIWSSSDLHRHALLSSR